MAGSISPFPLVRTGDRDHPVRTLQYLLRARKHPVAVDGIFGPKTDAAVRAFQMDEHLAVDGIVGPQHVVGADRHGQAGQPGRRGARGPGGVPVPQPLRRPGQGPADRRHLRPGDRGGRARVPAGAGPDIPSVAVDGIVGPVTWQRWSAGCSRSDRTGPHGARGRRQQRRRAASGVSGTPVSTAVRRGAGTRVRRSRSVATAHAVGGPRGASTVDRGICRTATYRRRPGFRRACIRRRAGATTTAARPRSPPQTQMTSWLSRCSATSSMSGMGTSDRWLADQTVPPGVVVERRDQPGVVGRSGGRSRPEARGR